MTHNQKKLKEDFFKQLDHQEKHANPRNLARKERMKYNLIGAVIGAIIFLILVAIMG